MMKEIDTRMENPTTNTNTASESIEPNTAQVPEPAEPGPSTRYNDMFGPLAFYLDLRCIFAYSHFLET
jgi:hypothetical protein